jgi:hypothetical protein
LTSSASSGTAIWARVEPPQKAGKRLVEGRVFAAGQQGLLGLSLSRPDLISPAAQVGHVGRMAARKGPNAAALAKAVRVWRAAGRLDEIAELQVALATESARLVDDVRDSDASASTRTDLFSEHRQQIAELRRAIPPIRPANPFDAIEAALVESFDTKRVDGEGDEAPELDKTARQMAAYPD